MSLPRESFVTNVIVLVALVILTVLTVIAAYVPLGPLHVPVALLLAGAKSALVVMFYMHMRHGVRADWVVIGAGLLLIGVLIGMIMSDYDTRGWG